jgi:hypothetical protein
MLLRLFAVTAAVASLLTFAGAQLEEDVMTISSSRRCIPDLYDMWDDCAWLVAAGVGALEVAAGCSEAPALLVNATAVNAAFDLPSRYKRLYSVVAASPAPWIALVASLSKCPWLLKRGLGVRHPARRRAARRLLCWTRRIACARRTLSACSLPCLKPLSTVRFLLAAVVHACKP